ncbi:histone H1.1-like [Takifugu rubripes]|uniref:histone H1.1-like n=1 Tax=Takifugu rubripes TaxID=31033 RepID=UPI00029894D9|nr:histone H1.1-like [Takifugu rubripes]|eukprot:XP_003974893.1 PREDICTED: histone H1.1-like [Takifugu rubripes]
MSSAATKRRTRSQPGTAGSTVSDLIMKAASAADARATVSLASLKKALKVGGYDVDRARISNALKGLVAKKYLVQVKGTGASSGSFKVNKNLSKPARKKGAQEKKNQVRRVQRTRVSTAAVTATGARKKAAKRSKKARKPTFGRPLTRSLRSATKK